MTTTTMRLTEEQLAQLERDGALVVPNFFTRDEAAELRSCAMALTDEFDLSTHPKTIFTTKTDEQHAGDDYFLNSGDKVRFFFEEEAFDKDGKLVVDRRQAINKIGHGLHELEPAFRRFTLHERVKCLGQQLAFKRPLILQSMVIFKQPFIGGEVTPHQDSTFLHTEPLSATGLWFALEDCTLNNGCLEFVPGSHKHGIDNGRRMIRDNKGGVEFTAPAKPYDESLFIPLECKTGSVVLIHGSVVHRSAANRSPNSRIIYTFHMIEGAPGYHYDHLNWLQPTIEIPFTPLYETDA